MKRWISVMILIGLLWLNAAPFFPRSADGDAPVPATAAEKAGSLSPLTADMSVYYVGIAVIAIVAILGVVCISAGRKK